MRRPLVLVVATLGVFALGYVLEWHFVTTMQAAQTQQLAAPGAAFDPMTVIWRPVIAWLLVAGAVAGVGWLLFRWADRDRASALAVVVLGAVGWLLPVLYYWEPTGSLLPNSVGQLIGTVGFIPISGAFLFVLGLSALVPRRVGREA